MFNKQVWSSRKCPECGATQYQFTWDGPQIYQVCHCHDSIVTCLGQKVKILVNKPTVKEKQP